jgi:hypothetical protein
MGSMNIYLEIDSVLLVNGETLANHADAFLQAIMMKYPDATYWLTPNDKVRRDEVGKLLTSQLKPETAALLDKIKVAEWNGVASDAINFKQDFLWFGNELWQEDLKALEKHDVIERFILVDLAKEPDILEGLANTVANSAA